MPRIQTIKVIPFNLEKACLQSSALINIWCLDKLKTMVVDALFHSLRSNTKLRKLEMEAIIKGNHKGQKFSFQTL